MTETGAGSVPGLAEIADIGRDTVRGGYSRHLFDGADRQLREWFVSRATGIGLDVDHDRRPSRPVGVVVFAEQEGSRFGVPCLGSKLLTGEVAASEALALTDASGCTLAETMAGAGLDPARAGRDDATLSRTGLFLGPWPRPLAAALRRSGQPRRHHPHVRPARS